MPAARPPRVGVARRAGAVAAGHELHTGDHRECGGGARPAAGGSRRRAPCEPGTPVARAGQRHHRDRAAGLLARAVPGGVRSALDRHHRLRTGPDDPARRVDAALPAPRRGPGGPGLLLPGGGRRGLGRGSAAAPAGGEVRRRRRGRRDRPRDRPRRAPPARHRRAAGAQPGPVPDDPARVHGRLLRRGGPGALRRSSRSTGSDRAARAGPGAARAGRLPRPARRRRGRRERARQRVRPGVGVPDRLRGRAPRAAPG